MDSCLSIYQDIAQRTNGDIYIGVVGPVRTGKSTFIKRFMEMMVIPNMDNIYQRERARDEMPQSGSGKTIMTAEPKFIPEEAAEIELSDGVSCSVRLIDCVGYMVEGAVGQTEEGNERMVMTPWHDTEIPITRAAEEGTTRVISDHSSIGIVVTTDGSVCGLPRESYAAAEARTVRELKSIGKPFIVLLNSSSPDSDEVRLMAGELSEQYGAQCIPVNCLELDEAKMEEILKAVLFEFPVNKFNIFLPAWADALGSESEVKKSLYQTIADAVSDVDKLSKAGSVSGKINECPLIDDAEISRILPGVGEVEIVVRMPQNIYYQTLSEESGFEIADDGDLISLLRSVSGLKDEYERVHTALCDVRENGYGIVMPSADEMVLEEPEIVRQGGRYGVKLKASAPAIHMIKTNVETEVSPALGGEKASDEILGFLLQGFDGDVARIWESNIFGKSLYDIAGESVTNKIQGLPEETQNKLQQTLQRIINEGSSGLICIIL